jgi:hypothetical protein
MDEIEAFLDECRADPWFQGHPELVDRLESVLTNLYLEGEGPEWEAIWDQVRTVVQRTSDTPVDRRQPELVLDYLRKNGRLVCSGSPGPGQSIKWAASQPIWPDGTRVRSIVITFRLVF